VQFTSLKLAGFKSFVELSEFHIETGVTAIVGPNGCGKSNLLEALRWVMGANSAKAMRADAMDDVIFSGTRQRPARNYADVVLTIDNHDRSAPSQFNDADVLEISRRIKRGAGSSYQINGKTCRAKDVQLLFADASTGANSPALVRQGQISELIAAKPQNRRRVLEEAAGISGLYTRRHEAELRLAAAQTNVSRLNDISEELEIQHQQLKRQVRIASRYRNLASEIRALEAFAALLRWNEARSALVDAKIELAELEQQSGSLAGTAARALAAAEAANDGMDELRQEQAIANALVAKLSAARENVERDERDAKARTIALEGRLAEIARDLAQISAQQADATRATDRLSAEQSQLATATTSDTEAQTKTLEAIADDAGRARSQAETAFEQLTNREAERQALIANAGAVLDTARARAQRLEQQLAQCETEAISLAPDLETLAAVQTAEQEQQTSAQKTDQLRSALATQEQVLAAADERVQTNRRDFDDSRRQRDEVTAEQTGLQKAMATSADKDWVSISENLSVAPGFERALAVALGDDLEASTDTKAPAYWQENTIDLPQQILPGSVQSMAKLVQGPAVLTARLSQIGVVDGKAGSKLAAQLLPGQRLVSREGQLWRWDGLHIRADAPSVAALRLEQKNRLQALTPLIEAADTETETRRDAWVSAKENRAILHEVLQADRRQLPELERRARSAGQVWQELQRGGIEREARANALQQKSEHWTKELAVARDEVRTAEAAASELPEEDNSARYQALDEARNTRDEARRDAADADASLRAAQRENENRVNRLRAIASEMLDWAKRVQDCDTRIAGLMVRETTTIAELEQAKAAPAEVDARRKQVFAECETAEQRLAAASDALAIADSHLREARDGTRVAESAAAAAREAKAGLLAKAEAAGERVGEIAHTIRETLGCAPEELENNEQDLRKIPQNTHEAEARLHKLRLERDGIGAVNLTADEQADELAERLANMHADRDELLAAIAKLRKGVDSLNREGRTRLLAAFEVINTHFKSLFLTLFGGGEAELRLTQSDDPLEAGLEIYACPPGKKMGTMSLMSGGEQALTAMALIFAVFLSNPAPVCVLDEVDAPLDDANVERFCAMLDEMVKRTQTRFIIITHNPLTMSRVDRLYGVTMAERGVSQLVSVDLQRAEDLIAAE